jgi:hypothetical protein
MLPLVLPSELQSELGSAKSGVTMIVDGFQKGVYQIEYPFANPQKFRKSHIPHVKNQKPLNQSAFKEADDLLTATAVATPSENTDTTKRKFRLRSNQDNELEQGEHQ